MSNSSALYLDTMAGISGDMFLAALLDLGYPLEILEDELAKLQLTGYSLATCHEKAQGIAAIKLTVTAEPQNILRTLPQIRQCLFDSSLSAGITEKADAVFTRLARAEATVHNIDMDKVHFHEVGALDTIIDIVGVIAGLHYLGIEKLFCSALPMPHGFVNCEHGKLPLPAPAVCELLQGIPCYGDPLDKELVTPTGAALIAELVTDFGPMPPMVLAKTGYGKGTHVFSDNRPNILRVHQGHLVQAAEDQHVTILETHLDDWNGEIYPHLCEMLMEAGALDVTLTPLLMKKGRPGYLLRVLCSHHKSFELQDTILTETSAIGLRIRTERRRTLPRKTVEVDTSWGMTTAKWVATPDGPRVYPEYENCRKLAKKHNVSLFQVYREIYKKSL